jgi:hypothetical protein
MKTTRLLAPVLLALIASSCASAPTGGKGGAAPAANGGEKKNGEDAKDLQAKLDKATLKLEIARIDARNGEAASARAVEAATLEADLAAGAVENYRGVLQPIEAAAGALALDRARQRVKESKEELEELERMYAQEEFADLTKELVLTRGRAALEMAQRDFDLAEKRAAQAREFEWPRKQRELEEKVAATRRALDEARSRAEKGQLERKLALMEAEEAVSKAREALEKAQPAG